MRIATALAPVATLLSVSVEARTHTSAEQKATIAICRQYVNTSNQDEANDEFQGYLNELSTEEKDYTLDVCAGYMEGRIDGMKKAAGKL